MASRSWVKTHSPYWSLHVEAWRQSGMARADYCRQHGLSTKTFERWTKHLISKEEAREHETAGNCNSRPLLRYWLTVHNCDVMGIKRCSLPETERMPSCSPKPLPRFVSCSHAREKPTIGRSTTAIRLMPGRAMNSVPR